MIQGIGRYMERASEKLLTLGTQGVLIAVLVLVVISLFLIPLPPAVLDVLLVINIVVALTLLVRGLFITEAVHLFSFPVILLLTTLYRLALNVCSTRLILLNGGEGLGAAGRVIQSFGVFVVQGRVTASVETHHFVVGAIIFAVIAIVNFLVIAKGSARVAEVSARFTLDAMPGKQLSIDSDLRAGNISKDEARRQRDQLFREAQFFGAMDGAMKFVQGDAIAGFVITFINAVGGVSIGVGLGQGFREAVETYGVLTIGDGLVSILPSLLISLCAGTIVTHVVGRENRGASGEIFVQVMSEPKALAISAAALVVISLVPGFPFLPFFGVALLMLLLLGQKGIGLTGGAPFLPQTDQAPGVSRRIHHVPGRDVGDSLSIVPAGDLLDDISPQTAVPALRIDVDPRLLSAADGNPAIEGPILLHYVSRVRARVYENRGVVLPDIIISGDENSERGGYRISVREEAVRAGQFLPDRVFVAANTSLLNVMGIQDCLAARHPVDHRSSAWVKSDERGLRALSHMGIEILEPYEFLVEETAASAFEVIDEVFGLNEVRTLLELTGDRYPHLIEEVFGLERLSYPEFADILRRLVREHVNVRDLKLILEGVAEFSSANGEVNDRQDWLTELHVFLRVVLRRSIMSESLGPGNKLRLFVLSSGVEEEFREALSLWDSPRRKPPLDPAFEMSLRTRSRQVFHPVLERGALPVVVICSADVRPAVQDFFRRQMLPADCVRTVAYEELSGKYEPESIGVISVES